MNLIKSLTSFVQIVKKINYPRLIFFGQPLYFNLFEKFFYPRKISYWSSKFLFKPSYSTKSVFINSNEKTKIKNFYSFSYFPEISTNINNSIKKTNSPALCMFHRSEKIYNKATCDLLIKMNQQLSNLKIFWCSKKTYNDFELIRFFEKNDIKNEQLNWFHPDELKNLNFFKYGNFFLDTMLTSSLSLNACAQGMPVLFFKDSRNALIPHIKNSILKFKTSSNSKKKMIFDLFNKISLSKCIASEHKYLTSLTKLMCADIEYYKIYSEVNVQALRAYNNENRRMLKKNFELLYKNA